MGKKNQKYIRWVENLKMAKDAEKEKSRTKEKKD